MHLVYDIDFVIINDSGLVFVLFLPLCRMALARLVGAAFIHVFSLLPFLLGEFLFGIHFFLIQVVKCIVDFLKRELAVFAVMG